MQEILLTDLIDVQVLQRIQNGFSKFTGMASLTTDAEGNPITEGSNFADFCTKYTRTTEKGLSRCMECDRKSGLMALSNGKPVVYTCHAGLVDYASPIMLEGQYLGSFLGGQIRTAPIDEELVRQTARDLGLDEEEYLDAARRTKQVTYEHAEEAAEFLAEIAAVLSEMAYKSYQSLQQSQRLERIARSHNDFIMDMNVNMRQRVLEWIDMAQGMQEENDAAKKEARLEKLMKMGHEFLNTIDETVEYSKTASGEIELHEKEYNIRDLIKGIRHSYKAEANEKGNNIKLEFADDLPEHLLGDAGRIRQIISRLVRSAIRNTENGEIILRIFCCRQSYATKTVIEIIDTGKGLSPKELDTVRNELENWTATGADVVGGMIVPFLLAEMSGSIEVDSIQGKGTVCRISIPQLAIYTEH